MEEENSETMQIKNISRIFSQVFKKYSQRIDKGNRNVDGVSFSLKLH